MEPMPSEAGPPVSASTWVKTVWVVYWVLS